MQSEWLEEPEGAFEDQEGLFDAQMSLPIPYLPAPQPFSTVIKRDGRREPFDKDKIARAILKAAETTGSEAVELAGSLASAVAIYLAKRLKDQPPTVDHVHDAVERVLFEMAQPRIALAYARYRDRRARIRRLREGDLRALLGELEEARDEREALGASTVLFVRTSGDTLISWDSNAIVEALVRETGLDRPLALMVALEVEQQLQGAGIKTLTTALIRELVSAKLVEHGLEEFQARHRRLGVALYDMERILRGSTPETMAQDPSGTDRVLARAVKKEYALSQVFSARVAEAHLRGDLHLQDLGQVDRLFSAIHPMEHILRYGIGLPGTPSFAKPPQHAETLLAQLIKAASLYETMFSAEQRWESVNHYFAPFLVGVQPRDLLQFAQALLYEFAFRALAQPGRPQPILLGLEWSLPQQLRDCGVSRLSAGDTALQYGDCLETAQRFAGALVEVLQSAEQVFPSPKLAVEINLESVHAEGFDAWLGQIARLILRRYPVRLLFNRGSAPVPETLRWQARTVVAHGLVLNLPRAAYRAGTEARLREELAGLVELAVAGHEEKRKFLDGLMDTDGAGPLGLLSLTREGSAYVEPGRERYLVAVEGLNECVEHLLGVGMEKSEEAFGLGTTVLEWLQEELRRQGEGRGLHVVAGQNRDAEVSRRFATLDSKAFPASSRRLLRISPADQSLQYSFGAALNHGAGPPSLEVLRQEGALQALAPGDACTILGLPVESWEVERILSYIHEVLQGTGIGALEFNLEGVS